ncbi:MAG: 50S ribosomal protein L25/general stress protein Ctc [Rhodobacteraceae bacterium]|nr:50S ribosomal protein L25/general stress protein Ctc [Paracoccaceae bacterium]
MAENTTLNATARAGTGKGAARAARRENLVPGIVYGGGSEPTAINLKFNELFKMLKAGGFLSTLLTLKIDGKDERVICRGVQRHVVKDLPIHVDFLRLSANSRINLMIPVQFLNEEESAGLKKGGTLVVVRNEVELKVTAGNIPNHLEVDLLNVEIGDTIHMSDITLPEGTRPMITDRDFVIANIGAPKTVDLDAEDDDSTEGEAAPEAEEGATEE